VIVARDVGRCEPVLGSRAAISASVEQGPHVRDLAHGRCVVKRRPAGLVRSIRVPAQAEQQRKNRVRLAPRRLVVQQRPRRRGIQDGPLAMEQLDHRNIATPYGQRDDRYVEPMAARVHIRTPIDQRTDSRKVTGLHSVLEVERRQRTHRYTMADPDGSRGPRNTQRMLRDAAQIERLGARRHLDCGAGFVAGWGGRVADLAGRSGSGCPRGAGFTKVRT
jgi:hypothetical protein